MLVFTGVHMSDGQDSTEPNKELQNPHLKFDTPVQLWRMVASVFNSALSCQSMASALSESASSPVHSFLRMHVSKTH